MRFHQTIEENANHLRRIAALLCALADLAERAAGRSFAVCCLVLWIIRPSEGIARDLVEKIAPGATCAPTLAWPRNGKAEALRLAQSFRSLAAAIAALAEHHLDPHPAAPANLLAAALFSAPIMPPARAAAIARLDSS